MENTNNHINLDEKDYQTILNHGGRAEKVVRTCKQNEFSKDFETFIEDLKVSKGVLLKLIFPNNITNIIEVYNKYIDDFFKILPNYCQIISGIDYDDIEENSMKYELIISGLPIK